MGIDAARGLALIGLMAVHILPTEDEMTGEPTWSYILFGGDSAALFALLAGVGLALSSGGRRRRRGRELAADRVGVAVRAILITVVGLWIGTVMPQDAPADNILIYYGVFFLLAIPFLHMGPKALFVCAAVFWIVGPLLMQGLRDVLPAYASDNPTFADVVKEPGATASQLLLTGSYPALCYLTYLLVGMGVGRLDLREKAIQIRLLVAGIGVAIFAQVTSYVLLYAVGGYEWLLSSSGMDKEELEEVLLSGPEDELPTDTAWWLVVDTPHTNTPLAIAASLGVGLAVLGFFLLVAPRARALLVLLSAMGAMTLTLYTVHLMGLSFEAHYDRPYLWFTVNLAANVLFAVIWQRTLGQGPLERVVSTSVSATRRVVLHRK
ncbi:UNVERIFIED_CONTAM: heparan-alpha-glucosaminide N-acetyltransferase domain-containing protein [Kocuria sp. CPCC 205316]|uniref:heparan-alpha-glucosaminide N-acetyltransferase domain-containing protein n=1 Tax=Kocuria TaxID=57493 RepID=UPI0036DD664E